MSTTPEQFPAPAWLEEWTKPRESKRVYDCMQIAHIRMSARNPRMRDAMLEFPPRCVIGFKLNDEIAYGIVTSIVEIDLDKPKKNMPRKVVALKFVPSPLHIAGATGESERDANYVMPEGVQVLGYAPDFTPDTMRAIVSPAGLA